MFMWVMNVGVDSLWRQYCGSCAAVPSGDCYLRRMGAMRPGQKNSAKEHALGKMKHYRRIFSRYEKLAMNYLSMLSFVGTLIWLR